MKPIQKILHIIFFIFLLFAMLFARNAAVFADDGSDVPTLPAKPTEPSAPTPPDKPQPDAPLTHTPPTAPTPPPDPRNSQGDSPNPNNVSTAGNGASSNPQTSLTDQTAQNNSQTNNGQSDSTIRSSSTTGNNSSSGNVGSSAVTTHDANTSGTVVNGSNTNLENAQVSEFDVNGDHNGDIVLDFPTNCILNCTSGVSTSQTNTAGVGNALVLSANSGNNSTSENTNGDSAITTGNANVDGNSLSFANTNIDGQVEFGVVNIYGNLNGDIILPDDQLPGTATNVATTSNGAFSTNQSSLTNQTPAGQSVPPEAPAGGPLGGAQNDSQSNNAGVTNAITTSATTGDNTTGENTTGDNSIQTGKGSVDANELTLANNNLDGGTWWLVLVNNDGNWSGQILGGDGNTASSPGLNFSLNPDGNIATTDNGASSTSQTTLTNQNAQNSSQSNNANVQSTLDLSANTGGNHADLNTTGTSTIKTGDAKIVANLVNFVNNNIHHGAKLIVTVVNIFGSWVGDFVTPGHTKENNKVAQSNTNNSSTTTTPQTPLRTPTLAAQSPLNASNNQTEQTNTTTPSTHILHPQPITRVAGIENRTEQSALKTLRINLAWLVIILPLLATGILMRKKIISSGKKA